MMVGLPCVQCGLEDFDDAEVMTVIVGYQEALPGGQAVSADPAAIHCAFERRESRGERLAEAVDTEIFEVDLRFLNQIVVDRLETEVLPAALDLVEQKSGRHGVPAVDLIRREESRVDIGGVQVSLGRRVIVGAIGVRRERASLRDYDDLVSCGLIFPKRPAERMANRAFARLKTIGERHVEDVRPEFEEVGDDAPVEQVVHTARFAAQSAERDGGEP